MAINASNPTTATGRKTVGDVLSGIALYRRQDLAYLRDLAQQARTPLSNLEAPSGETVRRLRDQFQKMVQGIPAKTVTDRDWPLAHHPDESVPVCTLRVDEVPVRPVDYHAKGNAVTTTRMFGGTKIPVDEIRALLVANEFALVSEALQTKVFTRGTIEGFEKRLKLLVGDTTRSIYNAPRMPRGHQARMALLDRLLPMDSDLLPDWHGGEDADLVALLQEHVKITPSASAGAPYWRPKGDVLPTIFSVLEHCVAKLKDGKLGELLKEQPELFVIECKNKEDRYEVSKLHDKTRPYFNPPAHWSILASFLHQAASHALYKVGGPLPTWNAYGWSAAHGGITRLVNEVKERSRKERGWGYVYGDDGDLYFKSGGHLYRVSPDVKQMDSCVDFDTVRLTYDYIIHCFERKHGPSPFWRSVVDALLQIFEKPRILISGTQLYTKPADGLLSGVVGTTLFDTVKSAVAYSSLMEEHASDPSVLLDSEYVTKWMLTHHGLVIKEGTWEPEALDLEVAPCYMDAQGRLQDPEDSLYGSGKFLGIQYVKVMGPSREEWLPFLPDLDWATALLAPRDAVLNTKMGNTEKQRLTFDRIRGYLTTGAAFSRNIRDSLYWWLDQLPGEVLLMQPQQTTPPEGVLFGEDADNWEYPTPEFLPDPFWVFDIYAQPDNQWHKPRTSLFPDWVLEKVSEFRAQDRRIRISMKDGATVVEPYIPATPDLPSILPQLPEAVHSELGSHWGPKVPDRALKPEKRADLPLVGAPLDLAKPGMTEKEAWAKEIVLKPKDKPLHALVDPDNLKPLKAYESAVDGVKVKVPPEMISKEPGTKLVHPPTVGGYMPPVEGGELIATLLKSSFPKLPYVAVRNPHLTPEGVAAYILHKSGQRAIWSFRSEPYTVGEGSQKVSRARVIGELHMGPVKARTVHTPQGPIQNLAKMKAEDLPVVQEWQSTSQRLIKESFWVWLTLANKKAAQVVASKAEQEDWALPATREIVPYSFVEGPLPPPEALAPSFPADVLVESRSGNVKVAGLVEPPKLVVNPDSGPISAEHIELPARAPNSVPFLDASSAVVVPPRSPVHSGYRVRRGRWWSGDDEVEGYENAYYDVVTHEWKLRPESLGSPPSPGPKPRLRRIEKRTREKRGPVQQQDSGLSASNSGSESSLDSVDAGVATSKKPLPPAPAGGWPLYLLVPAKMVREEDWEARKAFTAEHGRLPPRNPQRQARAIAAYKGKEKEMPAGRTLPVSKAGGNLSINPENLSIDDLQRLIDRKRDAEKKPKAKIPERGEGSGGGRQAKAQAAKAKPQHGKGGADQHRKNGAGPAGAHDTRAGDRLPGKRGRARRDPRHT